MQADARVRGKELQSAEQMLEYLPQWLQIDLLQLQNNEGECQESSLDHLPMWYLRKKKKQHVEVRNSAFLHYESWTISGKMYLVLSLVLHSTIWTLDFFFNRLKLDVITSFRIGHKSEVEKQKQKKNFFFWFELSSNSVIPRKTFLNHGSSF